MEAKNVRLNVHSTDEREGFLYLADIVYEACENTKKHQFSLVNPKTTATISRHTIIPSKGLGIPPGCVLSLLRLYAKHRGVDRYKVGFHSRRSCIPFIGWYKKSPWDIGTRIISDDLMVSQIAPNNQTQSLLGNVIAHVPKKLWINSDLDEGRVICFMSNGAPEAFLRSI
jgi:hypothetical protein